MADDEATIDALEQEFPLLAATAFAEARKQALDAGLSVYQSEGAAIYEVFPDGSKRFVKAIEPPRRVVRGTKITFG